MENNLGMVSRNPSFNARSPSPARLPFLHEVTPSPQGYPSPSEVTPLPQGYRSPPRLPLSPRSYPSPLEVTPLTRGYPLPRGYPSPPEVTPHPRSHPSFPRLLLSPEDTRAGQKTWRSKKWPDIARTGLPSKLPHKVGSESNESGHQKARGGPNECEIELWGLFLFSPVQFWTKKQ